MFAINADGVGFLGIKRKAFFNTNFMQLFIAKIVFVEKLLTYPKTKSGKWHFLWVVGETYPTIMVNPKVLTMNVEPI